MMFTGTSSLRKLLILRQNRGWAPSPLGDHFLWSLAFGLPSYLVGRELKRVGMIGGPPRSGCGSLLAIYIYLRLRFITPPPPFLP